MLTIIAREAAQDCLRLGRAMLERRRELDHLVVLLLDQHPVDPLTEDRLQVGELNPQLVVGKRQPLPRDRLQARQQIEAKEMTERKCHLALPARLWAVAGTGMASAEGLRRSVKGLSEIEFRERFGTEEACRKALFDMRWREGLACPACGHCGWCALKTRKLFQCNRCKKQVRLTAGTVFQDTKLPLTAWFTAIYHLVQGKNGISSIELARRLGVKRQTAWLIKHKLMRAMGAREAEKPKLAGRVEVDDAYLGGERPGGKRGRGAAGKTPFVAAVETTAEGRPRRLRLRVVKGFRKKEMERLAERDFAAGSNVVSDGLSCWPAVEQAGCQHFPMATGSGKRAASWVTKTCSSTVSSQPHARPCSRCTVMAGADAAASVIGRRQPVVWSTLQGVRTTLPWPPSP